MAGSKPRKPYSVQRHGIHENAGIKIISAVYNKINYRVMTYFTLSQWRRSVVKSEGPGRVSQVKPSNSKPIEIRFRFRRRNGLFAHFWLFFIFGRK